MHSEQNQLSPIHESSATASVIETDESAYDQLELDELFDELKKTQKPTQEALGDADDQFAKIKQSISKLPKITGTAESLTGDFTQDNVPLYLRSAKSDSMKKQGITNINDPILTTKKKTTEEDTSSGSKWFNMPKGELTESVKRDLKIIQQRAALDPKRHYKKDKWKVPNNFQIGTIIEGNTEYYSARLKNRDRHTTILESVMYDDDTQKYFKRKYDEIQVKKTSGKKSHYKKVQEMRRKF